ncbi:MAG: hypothetical protein KBG39_09755 [Opitutaceae bacterium]|nr:hypothetical protein [Opitutaceae bacterium]
MTPKHFFDTFVRAATADGEFQSTPNSARKFSPWEFDGMHDASASANHAVVEQRVVLRRHSPIQRETIQLDLLDDGNGRLKAAAFVRIHEAEKRAKNTANATLKSDRRTNDGNYFVEFCGRTARRKQIESALQADQRLQIEGNKVIIGSKISPEFVDHLILAARLIAHAEP